MIADIQPIDSFIVLQTEEFVRAISSPMLFNHVMRCYWFSELLAQRDGIVIDKELLFLSAAMHDLGLSDYERGPHRFEIEGAIAARKFLLDQGVDDERAWRVWDNIALHMWDLNIHRNDTSRLLQQGIYCDVRGDASRTLDPADVEVVLQRFPRLGFKQAFYELLRKEVVEKQPYEHCYHLCTCIAHQEAWITMPNAKAIIDGAPFNE